MTTRTTRTPPAPGPMRPATRAMPGKTVPKAIKWQPYLTLKGTGSFEVIQPASFWLDTTDFNNVVVRTHLLSIDASCELVLETAATPNGPWNSAAVMTAVGLVETTLMSSSSTDLLAGYLRWRYESTLAAATASTITFKMTVYPVAEGYRKLNLEPRVA
jgi:hypothetical protein